jgi:hypothetical protein
MTRSGHQDDLGNPNRRLVELRRVFLSGEMHMGRLLLSIAALLAGLSNAAFGQTSPASEIAPGGKLRVGMIAITVLGGVAEPVAGFVGQKLSAAVEPVMYPNPEAYLQSFGKSEWDIAIGPRVLAPPTRWIQRRTFEPSVSSTSPRREQNFPISLR